MPVSSCAKWIVRLPDTGEQCHGNDELAQMNEAYRVHSQDT